MMMTLLSSAAAAAAAAAPAACVCIYAMCVDVPISIGAHIYIDTYTCSCICIYMYICLCMHTYICIIHVYTYFRALFLASLPLAPLFGGRRPGTAIHRADGAGMQSRESEDRSCSGKVRALSNRFYVLPSASLFAGMCSYVFL